jgi:hypothetical protein
MAVKRSKSIKYKSVPKTVHRKGSKKPVKTHVLVLKAKYKK